MKKFEKLTLAAQTVRHMKAEQWLWRGIYTFNSKVLPAKKVRIPQITEIRPLLHVYSCPCEPDTEQANALCKGEFTLVSGQKAAFDGEIDWDMAGNTYRLMCFRLNSFDWLLTLSDAYLKTGEQRYIKRGLELIRHWQDRCGSHVQGDKWNPYVIAGRLMNWIGFVSRYAGEEKTEIAGWIAAQAKVLASSVEYQLGANHLLSEGKALMYAGAFTKNDKLYRKGKKLLLREFPRQFLKDGGHYERSVSYHVESLQQYFEAAQLMRLLEDADWEAFAARLETPYAFLSGMLGETGEIPLFNDAALDYPMDARDFLATSGLLFETAAPGSRKGPYCSRWDREGRRLHADWRVSYSKLYPDTGFYTDRFAGNTLFFHAGDHGPDCNLGHTHADSLSVLWTSDRGEMFADSGVYTYAPGEDRNACRATAAHNTVEVDGVDSAQVWGAFRVAKRGHTRILEVNDRGITAEHDGYCKILSDPVLHRRTLTRGNEGEIFSVTDLLIPHKQTHTAVLRFHLAPGCSARLLDRHRVLLREGYVLWCSEAVTLEKSRVARYFGRPEETVCITVKFEIQGETTVKTAVSAI